MTKTEVVVNALAEYLDCAETVPLTKRVAELEAKVEELQTLGKKKFSEEGKQSQ